MPTETATELAAAPAERMGQPHDPRHVVRIRPSPSWRAVNFRELWQFRELLYFLVWRDLKVRYKQTALGAAWAVIVPVFTMLVFTLFFGKIGGFDQKSQGFPFTVFSYAALLPWIFFSNAVNMASNSLVSNANLVSKVYFPRLLVPASAVLGGLVDYLISFSVLGGMMAWYGLAPAPAAVVVIPLLTLLLGALALGVGLWLSALNVQYRDIRYVVPFIMQIWMFGSPIIYSMQWIAEEYPQYLWLVALNPVAGIMEGFRACLLPAGKWDLAPLALSVAFTAVILVSGCFYFRRMEKTFAVAATRLSFMSDTVIQASKISKQYRLGKSFRPGQRTFRETLTETFRAPLTYWQKRPADGAAAQKNGFIWALKDVDFEISRGEVVGIIGRNGAGKSTLLKVLSRITEPTAGEATIFGRVGSLLEVGTGFHPELTGRENIFLNGAILGMKRAEIVQKFDEIVAFAEVEKFIDTAVKHYSSGMYMRLAFAVAAHLEPEILIVDEVLAVGDAGFQKKCLGKMGDVAKSGRTVLFVSHNAHAIRSLCSRAILLKAGTVHADGPALEVLSQYERENQGVQITADTAVRDAQFRRGSGEVRFTSIEILDAAGRPRREFEPGEAVRFALSYECRSAVSDLSTVLVLKCEQGERNLTSLRYVLSARPLPAGHRGRAVIELSEISLRPGCFPLYFWLGRSALHAYDVVDELVEPLIVYSRRSMEELGYDPANADSYVTLPSRLLEHGPDGIS